MTNHNHKHIYALTIRQTPGEKFTYCNPKSGLTHEWTVPEDGVVLFYIGETTMPFKERHSKHRTFAKKLITHLQGLPTIDPHEYPVYYFTTEFCGENGRNFEIHALQEGDGLSEAEWIEHALSTGHPIQNSASGSISTVKGYKKPDLSINGQFKAINEANLPKKAQKEEITAEVIQARRAAWIAERKKQGLA